MSIEQALLSEWMRVAMASSSAVFRSESVGRGYRILSSHEVKMGIKNPDSTSCEIINRSSIRRRSEIWNRGGRHAVLHFTTTIVMGITGYVT